MSLKDLSELSVEEKRKFLGQFLQKAQSTGTSNLSFEQLRLWVIAQLDPTVPNHSFTTLKLSGSLQIEILERSLSEVIQRHELLRTTLIELEGQPLKVVSPTESLNLSVVDLTGIPGDEQATRIQEIAQAEIQQPLALNQKPLFRVTVIRLTATESVLLVTIHQIVADSISVEIFVRELIILYDAFVHNLPLPLPKTKAPFGDFVTWEKKWIQTQQAREQLDYWRTQLTDLSGLKLAVDRAQTTGKTYHSEVHSCQLSSDLVNQLDALGKQEDATLFMTVLTAFKMLLARYCQQEDIALGTLVSRRMHSQWEEVIGPLTNTLVLRTDLSGNPSVTALLQRVRQVCLEAYDHQDFPFAKLVEILQLQQHLNEFALIMFQFQEYSGEDFGDLPSLSVTPLELPIKTTLFDLTLSAITTERGMDLQIEFNTDRFESAFIARMLGHLQVLLETMVADSSRCWSELPMITEGERHQLLVEWNQTSYAYPEILIQELIEAQVKRSPQTVAVVCGDRQLTYSQLNEQANQLAHYLRSLGISQETRVGICLERSPDLVVGLLAILKAGGVYVPLDRDYPRPRIQYMLADSQVQILLTQQSFLDIFPESNPPKVCLDRDADAITGFPTTDLPPNSTPDSLAYIIYTSGSTGNPKGVMIAHRSVVSDLGWRQRQLPLTERDRVLQNFSYCFDPSIPATFWPLTVGAQVVIVPSGELYDCTILMKRMVEHQITVYAAAPSLQTVLWEEPNLVPTSLRYILCGGERVSTELQQRFFKYLSAEVYNIYGPTETTVEATFWHCPHVDNPQVAPIGRPIANLQIYLLDHHHQPVPIGVPGEIYIGGVGLARGYHNRPDLTAEKFIPHPFNLESGARLYRTGDLGQYREDGNVEFLGRIDNQVKIRGFRIEIGEIEAAINLHSAVREAAVIVDKDRFGELRLLGYVVLNNSATLSPETLRSFLRENLPDYTIPKLWVFLDELPRTPNGKIDRKALPSPEASQFEDTKVIIPPRTPLEIEIAQAFATVLDVQRIGVNENLFELGGTSLIVARLTSRLSNKYNVSIPLDYFFKVPTVEGVARVIEMYQQGGLEGVISDSTAAQLESEAVLDPEINPAGLPIAKYCNPNAVLVTGATGYLGAFIVQQLLKNTKADIYCLVRASDIEEGKTRLEKTLQLYLIWEDSFSTRIHPVIGDLEKPLIGLSSQQFLALAAAVDTIYHSGALVNFIYPYSRLKAPNVQGTQEILRLACQVKLKSVHFVSTLDVLLSTHAPRPFLENDRALHNPVQVPYGYPRSKWVAEKIVTLARDRGIPVCIYRAGLMMSHSETGATQTNDYLLVALRGFIPMGILPNYPRIIDPIPVDYASQAIVHLSRQESSIGKHFHLWNPHPVPLSKLYEWIESFGYRLKIVSFEEARQQAIQVESSHPLYPLVPLIRDEDEEPPVALDPQFIDTHHPKLECQNTLKGLEGSSIECPPMNEKLMHLCLTYLVKIGFLEAPK
ncbi:non-ribosomal peptide synthetase [Mastigocoleus sp. MO_188.B34]|uniref:non-ribosomal peptide synthetase n=1 Tax=Mastigocoleus sp. MO_188.B34 TaxID=3036635 RepID=UPI0026054E25|nr:non-ribosomal peptide synthetase [Mastigocoleus sp. MO_188.B34]MDJ0695420.1 amino acid adenylation domain-containing protein [Mastigocoleus sp. MO_188.B34]